MSHDANSFVQGGVSSHLFDYATDLFGRPSQFKPEWLNGTGVVLISSAPQVVARSASSALMAIEQALASNATAIDYANPFSDWQLIWLEQAARDGNTQAFVNLWQQIDWAARQSTEIASAVRLAISAEAPQLARALSIKGAALHPEDVELQTLARVLAPPIVSTRLVTTRPDIRADRDWLLANRKIYLGRWVALRNGELLAVADTADDLADQLGDVRNSGILITQIW